LLWGVLMAFLSLLPAVGSSIVWAPIAAYLLLSGSFWRGLTLVFCGIFVIGLVDNVLRPLLIGKDTKMPDYLVLISTLGGLTLFGLNGFVIGPLIAALFIATWDLYVNHKISINLP
jgi:predicted PurR-regulated permease PerM